ncbi:hypothetical protein C2G38_2074194 [Gigaspora rosea]|uniref:DUF7431 domain-containing protein n=1 Tax=Gigaspora rosea TaxID=44941 RepID=A0A397VNS2_9GLOM|nr:hypothetical protein C2G38_2074194 [Gigaspora rosea]
MVFDLLYNELRHKLLELYGQKILLSDTFEVKFNNQNIMKPYTWVPKCVPPNMKDNQIYATVYNVNCVHEVFSVHAVYKDPVPTLVINCIKSMSEKEILSRGKKFNYIIKVTWMIIGYRNDFNFEPSLGPELISCTLSFNPYKKPNLSKIFKFPD